MGVLTLGLLLLLVARVCPAGDEVAEDRSRWTPRRTPSAGHRAVAVLAVMGAVVVLVASGRYRAPVVAEAPHPLTQASFSLEGLDHPNGPGLGGWTWSGGDWSVTNGLARVVHDRVRPIVAYVDIESTDLSAEVTLPRPVVGAGLAFRVVDGRNFWLWSPALSPRSFTLVHVTDGFTRIINSSEPLGTPAVAVTPGGTVPPASLGPEVTIGVHAEGAQVDLLVNGSVVLTAVDDAPAGTGAGLGARAVAQTAATFDGLRITTD